MEILSYLSLKSLFVSFPPSFRLPKAALPSSSCLLVTPGVRESVIYRGVQVLLARRQDVRRHKCALITSCLLSLPSYTVSQLSPDRAYEIMRLRGG